VIITIVDFASLIHPILSDINLKGHHRFLGVGGR
jgi:hypothetical protein